MSEIPPISCTAFAGNRRVASGGLGDVAVEVKGLADRGEAAPILVFDDDSGRTIEIDLRGTREQMLARLATATTWEKAPSVTADASAPRGPGRPKLGVVAREVTLLPRHWEWLGMQPGGASVALRRLVEDARRTSGKRDAVRHAQESAYRFMSTLAGDLPGFEEATRALFARNAGRFGECIEGWPRDISQHARQIAATAFD
jgi:uncharacterized protein